MLQVRARVVDASASARVLLATTHLESTRQAEAERERQLDYCLAQAGRARLPALLGGDFNLRDPEATKALAKARANGWEFSDAWESCGKDEAERWTWDMQTNTNVPDVGLGQPRLRFDRVYSSRGRFLAFRLAGRQRLSVGCFVSDHWAVSCDWAYGA